MRAWVNGYYLHAIQEREGGRGDLQEYFITKKQRKPCLRSAEEGGSPAPLLLVSMHRPPREVKDYLQALINWVWDGIEAKDCRPQREGI